MSLNCSPKRDTTAYCAEGPPPYTTRPPLNRSASTNHSFPSRALVRTRAGTLYAEQRPKPPSYPPGNTSTHAGPLERPCPDKPQYDGRAISTDGHRQSDDEDDEEGSIVFVRVPRSIMNGGCSGGGEMANANGQLIRRGDESGGGRRRTVTVLWGLSSAMRLESWLVLLKRELHLYRAFDDDSDHIYRKSEHNEFFHYLNDIVIGIGDEARVLYGWTYRRHNTNHASYVQKHLHLATSAISIWNSFYDWRFDPSNQKMRSQQEPGLPSDPTSERSRKAFSERKASMETVDGVLRLLGDVEMDEGIRGILDMQNGLRQQWKNDGMVSSREAERMGWICGIKV